MKKNTMVGMLLAIIGFIGTCSSISTISDDKNNWLFGYDYEPPLTGHEIGMIALLIGSIIIIGVGAAFLLKKVDLDSITSTFAGSDRDESNPALKTLFPDSNWLCPACKTVMRNDMMFCSKCGSMRPPKKTKKLCAQCGSVVPPEHAFCPTCGAWQKPEPKTWLCSQCGKELDVELNFCPYCGQKKSTE